MTAKRKKVTSSDVARLAGVSQSTVSMVLNSSSGTTFSDETTQRVLNACASLGYKVKEHRTVSTINGKLILVICPSFSNLYYINLIEAIQERAQELGYCVLVNNTFRSGNGEASFLQLVYDLPVAGVVFIYQPNNPMALERLDKSVPIVLINDKNPTMDVDLVELNSVKLGMIIADHLINLGHTRVAYVTTPLHKEQLARRRRLEGLEIEFGKHGLSADNILVCTAEGEGIDTNHKLSEYETGYLVTKKVLGKYDFTAIVGTNDMVAFGVLDALGEDKYRVPQDYSVCGCDNTMPSRLHSVSLTSVEHFSAQKGKEAVDILVRKIENGSMVANSPVSVIRVEYAPRLIARNSTGVCKSDRKSR